MTPEEQRIAIAEFCGWRELNKTGIFWHEELKQFAFGPNLAIICQKLGVTGGRCLLNYPEDLNAIHEAEKVLIERGLMCGYFYKLSKFTRWEFHATATQRAEALLRTIGKWK